MIGRDHEHWANRPGGIATTLNISDGLLAIQIMSEAKEAAAKDLRDIEAEQWPSSTVPKDIVVMAARRRLRVAKEALDWALRMLNTHGDAAVIGTVLTTGLPRGDAAVEPDDGR